MQKLCSRKCQGEFLWKDDAVRTKLTESFSKLARKRHDAGDDTIGWKTRRNREPSYPEACVILILDQLCVKYEREFKIGKFFSDFAFKDQMITLEIDGRHHDDVLVKQKDLRKELFIKEQGWSTFRIRWSTFDVVKQELVNFLKQNALVVSNG